MAAGVTRSKENKSTGTEQGSAGDGVQSKVEGPIHSTVAQTMTTSSIGGGARSDGNGVNGNIPITLAIPASNGP